jgi:hypothetical protein
MQAFQGMQDSEGHHCTCSCHGTGLLRPATPFSAALPPTPPSSATSMQSPTSASVPLVSSTAFPFDTPPPLDWPAALQARSKRMNGGNLSVQNKIKYDYCAFCKNNGEDDDVGRS